MSYGLTLITGPAEEPISLAEARLHLRVSDTIDDELILSLIIAAREWAEAYTGRALLPQTWEMSLDQFPPSGKIYLPKSPVISVTSIVYLDENGASQTMDTGAYVVDDSSVPGRIVRAWGRIWPWTRWCTPKSVVVRFVAGYASVADVPEGIKAAIKLRIGTLYENRENPTGMNAAESLLSLYRVVEAV